LQGLLFGTGRSKRIAICGLLWICAAVAEGGDWMPLGRFVLPGALLMALAFSPEALRLAPKLGHIVRIGAVLMVLAVNLCSVYERVELSKSGVNISYPEQEFRNEWVRATGAERVAYLDIGRFGFYLESVDILDIAGLTDRTIARSRGGHGEHELSERYFVARNPDIVMIRVTRLSRIGTDTHIETSHSERMLFESPFFHRRYRVLFCMVPAYERDPLHGIMVFARADFQIPERYVSGLPGFLKPFQGGNPFDLPLVYFPRWTPPR